MKILNQIFFGLILIFITSNGIAQTNYLTTYGGTLRDEGRSFIQMGDGGFAIAGTTNSFGSGGVDVFLLRLNAAGNIQYSKTFGTAFNDEATCINRTLDGGFIILGRRALSGNTTYASFLIKTDSLGTLLWSQVYNAGGSQSPVNVKATPDGGYIFVGRYASVNNGEEGFVIKTNATGAVVWQKEVTGNLTEQLWDVTPTTDGGYFIVGESESVTAGGDDDFLAIKVDAAGNTQWTKIFGDNFFNSCYSGIQTADGGYLLSGYSIQSNRNVHMVKLNSLGNITWAKTFASTFDEIAPAVKQVPGGYLMYTWAYANNNFGLADIGLIRTNATGDIIYSRKFGSTNGDGGTNNANTCQFLSDSTIGAVGYTESYGYGSAGANVFFIKTNTTGLVPNGCSSSTYTLNEGIFAVDTTSNPNIVAGTFTTLAYSPLTTIPSPCTTNPCIQNNPFDIYLGPDITSCQGSTVLDAGSPGSTYLWNTGAVSQTITVTTPGTYFVTVQNSCGTARDTIVVQIGANPVVALGADTVICPGGSLQLNAGVQPGASYLWNTGAITQTINVATPGIYYVEVTNSCGTGADTITVGTANPPAVNLGPNITGCIGTPVTLNAGNPGSTYLWSTNATTQSITVNASGTYFVRVQNACGISRDTIVVQLNTAPVVNLGADAVLCPGQSLTLNAGNPGSTYLWNTFSFNQSITVTTPGTYFVGVGNSCGTDVDSITITAQTLPVVNLGPDVITCAGTPVTLNAGNPGSTYLWNTTATSQTISVSTNGTYIVGVQNACGADADTVLVQFNTPPVVNLGNDTVFCQNQQVTLTAGPVGPTYLWNTGSTNPSITVSTGGTYFVSAQNNCGIDRDTVTLSFVNAPVLNVNLGNDTTICPNAPTIVLNAGNPGATYLWNNNTTAQTLNVTAAGLYSVTVQNACYTDTDSITISFINAQPIVLNLGPDIDTCLLSLSNFPLNPAAQNATQYTWSTQETTPVISVNASGTYYVTATNACYSNTDSITVALNLIPVVALGNDTTLCNGNTITLFASTPFINYVWNDGTTAESIVVSQPGQYWLQQTNPLTGCTDTDTLQVAFNQAPTINLGDDVAVCAASYALSPVSADSATIIWNTNETSPGITVTQSGWYWATVQNECGSFTDSVYVTLIQSLDSLVVIPNVFTPNGDGYNETFNIPGLAGINGTMYIYNRWGNKLFETNDFINGWNGKEHPEGVYFYIIEYTDCNTQLGKDHGTVTLLRSEN